MTKSNPFVSDEDMPGWILPVAIGGGALAMILLLKKRRGR